MWRTDEPPNDTRVLVSVKAKVWIARYRLRWPDFKEFEWSFEGKTISQTKNWAVDGWQELPKAVNAPAPEPNRYWNPTCYLDALELSTRADNALRSAGITSKEQILALTFEDLLKLPKVGELTARGIMEWRDRPNEEVLARL
jgi:DNA-directed RNA polymerase alpha subunit